MSVVPILFTKTLSHKELKSLVQSHEADIAELGLKPGSV